MATLVGTKGQVVIEKSIRDALGIQPGSIAVQRHVGNQVVITFFEPTRSRSLKGTLADFAKVTTTDSVALAQAEEAAWSNAASEEWRERMRGAS